MVNWCEKVKWTYSSVYLSITNNVKSYKKFNEKAQMANFSDLTRQRQELFAVVPCERARPEHSENVVVFEVSMF